MNSDLENRVAELEARATEINLIFDQAIDLAARLLSARVAQQILAEIATLRGELPDKAFLLRQAAVCREVAADSRDANMQAKMQWLDAEFERTAHTD